MKLQIDIVDAFTTTRFKGNSAAVVITQQWLPDDVMQSIASENNLSETAFLVNTEDGHAIRWFSPLTEIDFCGHATLAASFVLFERFPQKAALKLYAKAVGTMTIVKSDNGQITMDFPNRKPEPLERIPAQLLKGLSIAPNKVLKNNQAYFAVYNNQKDVLAVQQDKDYLTQLGPLDVVVTALANKSPEYDFISRYFWPANGGDEDPVTGSIHTGLAPYWSNILGKNELVAFQASKRGGILYCEIKNDRVLISGHAVRYLCGHIDV